MAKIFDRRTFDFTPVSSSTVTAGTIDFADYGLTTSTQSTIRLEVWGYVYRDDTASSEGAARRIILFYTQEGVTLTPHDVSDTSNPLRMGSAELSALPLSALGGSVTGLTVDLTATIAAITGTWFGTIVADVTIFSEDL